MKTTLGIDGIRKLLESHPEFEWMRYELDFDSIRVVISRKGKLFSGSYTNAEARGEAMRSAVWRDHTDKMMNNAAFRRAAESAFPEFFPDSIPHTPQPNIIAAIRTLRAERGLSYECARDEAIRFFLKRGWEIPKFMKGMAQRAIGGNKQ